MSKEDITAFIGEQAKEDYAGRKATEDSIKMFKYFMANPDGVAPGEEGAA